MDKKTLFETLKHLNYRHEKAAKAKVKVECDRIFNLAQSNSIDFNSGLKKYVYSSSGIKRYVAHYHSAFDEGYSVERNLAHEIVKACKIDFPSRSSMMHELFECEKILPLMMSFTIVRFDFRGYFYSLKPMYVWECYLQERLPNYVDKELIESYCRQVDIAYPGLEMSNVLAEIMAIEFDRRLKSFVQEYGIIFYGRFVDDGILILRDGVDKEKLLRLMRRALRETFRCETSGFKCTTSFHKNGSAKFLIKTMRDIYNTSLDMTFLGYAFHMEFKNETLIILYGIDSMKISKYRDRLVRALNKCKTSNQCFLALRLLCSRIVYSVKDGEIDLWKEKGFTSVYKELGQIDPALIMPQTKADLESLSADAMNASRNFGLITAPHKFAIEHGHRFDYFYSIMHGSTLIFDYHSRVGCKWDALHSYVKIMHGSFRRSDYQSLTKELLIKSSVGY